MSSAFVVIWGIFVYLTGLVIGFKLGKDFEHYRQHKNDKDTWDQDAH